VTIAHRAGSAFLALSAMCAPVLAQDSGDAEQHLRQHLLSQFSLILQAHDTPGGLAVPLPDGLFDGRNNLRPDGEIKLTHLAEVITSHPGLAVRLEGDTGSAAGKRRMDSVRAWLGVHGIAPAQIAIQQGSGTAELVVSGKIIGVTDSEADRAASPPVTPVVATPVTPPAAAPAPPAAPAAPASLFQGAPFSLDDLIGRVGIIADSRLGVAIARRGISFSPTPADYDKLKAAGAGPRVTEAIALEVAEGRAGKHP
jgi:hypothetical protein